MYFSKTGVQNKVLYQYKNHKQIEFCVKLKNSINLNNFT